MPHTLRDCDDCKFCIYTQEADSPRCHKCCGHKDDAWDFAGPDGEDAECYCDWDDGRGPTGWSTD